MWNVIVIGPGIDGQAVAAALCKRSKRVRRAEATLKPRVLTSCRIMPSGRRWLSPSSTLAAPIVRQAQADKQHCRKSGLGVMGALVVGSILGSGTGAARTLAGNACTLLCADVAAAP